MRKTLPTRAYSAPYVSTPTTLLAEWSPIDDSRLAWRRSGVARGAGAGVGRRPGAERHSFFIRLSTTAAHHPPSQASPSGRAGACWGADLATSAAAGRGDPRRRRGRGEARRSSASSAAVARDATRLALARSSVALARAFEAVLRPLRGRRPNAQAVATREQRSGPGLSSRPRRTTSQPKQAASTADEAVAVDASTADDIVAEAASTVGQGPGRGGGRVHGGRGRV